MGHQESGRKLTKGHWLVFGFLLVIGGLTYGRLIWMGGLFGDDPAALFAFHRLGGAGFDEFYGWARPFSTWIYKLVAPFAGENVRVWHACAIIIRILSAWMLYLFIDEVSEKESAIPLFTASIALVYPGFSQQAHALHFLLHFSVLTIALLSQCLMVRALRGQEKQARTRLMVLSLITASVHLSIEYFIGLEFLRPLVIYFVLRDQQEERISVREVMKYWLPFAVLLSGYLVWRIFLFQPDYPTIRIFELFSEKPWHVFSDFLFRLAEDIWKVSILAWNEIFVFSSNDHGDFLYVLISLILSLGIGWLFMTFFQQADADHNNRRRFLILGAGGIICGGIPLWVSQLPLETVFPWNRTTLCFLFGVSAVTASALIYLPEKARVTVFSTMIGFSMVFQFRVGLDYQYQWDKVRALFTQLTTHAPEIEPHTLILYDELPIRYYSANNLTAFLNWTYDPSRGDGPELYKMFEISERYGNLLPAFEAGIPIEHDSFRGSTSQVLVIAVDPEGCLHVLDSDKPAPFQLPQMTAEALNLSDPQSIMKAARSKLELPNVLQPVGSLYNCKKE